MSVRSSDTVSSPNIDEINKKRSQYDNDKKIIITSICLLVLAIGITIAYNNHDALEFMKAHKWECIASGTVLGLLASGLLIYLLCMESPDDEKKIFDEALETEPQPAEAQNDRMAI